MTTVERVNHNEFDPDDPESQRQMMRPPDIEQDMKEMDRRRRVDVILNSQVFREELERIIESQLSDGYLPASLSALQQVTELLMPGATTRPTRFGHYGPPITIFVVSMHLNMLKVKNCCDVNWLPFIV
ncbi:hypothetical protein SSS_09525 [Sarcoptes scabiei]|nr:hypothetical protein SSS_09525 [Sarcoptes scabiei]